VLDVHIELLEAALVEQHMEPFTRGQLALGVLGGNAFLAPTLARSGAAAFELGDIGGHALSRGMERER
jgi:hypothetical protein